MMYKKRIDLQSQAKSRSKFGAYAFESKDPSDANDRIAKEKG